MGFGKDHKGVIIREERSQSLLTLADTTALLIGTKLAIADDFRMLKSEVQCSFVGGTAGDTEGLLIGIADGDLTASEISSAITINAPLDANDIVGSNIAERFNVLFGGLVLGPNLTEGTFRGEGNSQMMHVKPRWTFGTTKSWNWFIFNNTGSPLTTGASVRILAKSFGVWIR